MKIITNKKFYIQEKDLKLIFKTTDSVNLFCLNIENNFEIC